jgi:hypothetical protein
MVLATHIPGRLTFLHDVEVQARFLVALPVLIVGELIVPSRIRPVVQQFAERRIVPPFPLLLEIPSGFPHSHRFDDGIDISEELQKQQIA